MFILNKKQHFSKVIIHAYNTSMTSVDKLCKTLSDYGAKPYIENNVDKFVITMHLFNTNLVARALLQKYSSKYADEISSVIASMIYEICNRLDFDFEPISGAYLEIGDTLEDIVRNMGISSNTMLCRAVAIGSLRFAFNGEYNPEEQGYNRITVEDALSRIFQGFFAEIQNYQP